MDHQCDQCNHMTMIKASLKKHMTHVHRPSLGGDNSLLLEAESLRQDVKENSLDPSELGDDKEFPLANSTLETELAALDKILL